MSSDRISIPRDEYRLLFGVYVAAMLSAPEEGTKLYAAIDEYREVSNRRHAADAEQAGMA